MAEDGNKEQPIIIKKKKGHGGHGHHGGAWKVAYADFVTAMMAFFIVMWILGQNEPIKKAVERYFSNTPEVGAFEGQRGDVMIDLQLKPSKLGEGKGIEKGQGSGEDRAETKGKDDEKHEFTFWIEHKDSVPGMRNDDRSKQDSIKSAEKVKQAGNTLKKMLQKLGNQSPELSELLKSITVEMTNEGLRIELIESSESVFFEIGRAALKKAAKIILEKLGMEIGKLPNPLEIEGHTDSRKYHSGATYTNWELSSDRANSTRNFLEYHGLWDGQVSKVTGFADRKLKKPENPFDISNRRISILIRYLKESAFSSNSVE